MNEQKLSLKQRLEAVNEELLMLFPEIDEKGKKMTYSGAEAQEKSKQFALGIGGILAMETASIIMDHLDEFIDFDEGEAEALMQKVTNKLSEYQEGLGYEKYL